MWIADFIVNRCSDPENKMGRVCADAIRLTFRDIPLILNIDQKGVFAAALARSRIGRK
jgi:hypothetical protein